MEGFWNSRIFASRCLFAPLLRQIEPVIYQGGPSATSQSGKYANLAVIDLAQTAIPLPSNTHRMFTFFLKSAFIQQQATLISAQQLIGLLRNLIHHRFTVPLRLG